MKLASKNFSRAVSANHEHERRLSQHHANLDERKLKARGAINCDVRSLQADLSRINAKTPVLDDYLRKIKPPPSSAVPALPASATARQGRNTTGSVRYRRNRSPKDTASAHAQQERVISRSDSELMTSFNNVERFPYSMMDPDVESKIADFLRRLSLGESGNDALRDKVFTKRNEVGTDGFKDRSKSKAQTARGMAVHTSAQLQVPPDGATMADAALIVQSSSYVERLRHVLQRDADSCNLHTRFTDPVFETRLDNFKIIARKIQEARERRAKSAMNTGRLVKDDVALESLAPPSQSLDVKGIDSQSDISVPGRCGLQSRTRRKQLSITCI